VKTPLPPTCPDRGHDLLLDGAIEECSPGSWRCVECRRINDREAKRKKTAAATACRNGHPYTKDSVRFVTTKNGDLIRTCTICHKQANSASERRRRKNAPPVITAARADRMLTLRVERESACQLRREEIDRELDSLRCRPIQPATT